MRAFYSLLFAAVLTLAGLGACKNYINEDDSPEIPGNTPLRSDKVLNVSTNEVHFHELARIHQDIVVEGDNWWISKLVFNDGTVYYCSDDIIKQLLKSKLFTIKEDWIFVNIAHYLITIQVDLNLSDEDVERYKFNLTAPSSAPASYGLNESADRHCTIFITDGVNEQQITIYQSGYNPENYVDYTISESLLEFDSAGDSKTLFINTVNAPVAVALYSYIDDSGKIVSNHIEVPFSNSFGWMTIDASCDKFVFQALPNPSPEERKFTIALSSSPADYTEVVCIQKGISSQQ